MNSTFQIFDDFNSLKTLSKPKLHIRIQQRNGRKCITTIEGFETDLDLKRICKALRKLFNVSGKVVDLDDDTQVIQLQGDQRETVRNWVLEQEIIPLAEKDRIVLHGF
jgi:translation initiation factor 1